MRRTWIAVRLTSMVLMIVLRFGAGRLRGQTLQGSPTEVNLTRAETLALYYETMPLPGDEFEQPTTRRRTLSSRRDLAFPVLSRIEQHKTEASIWSPTNGGRSTLTRAHYLVVPTWYDGQEKIPHDIQEIKSVMKEVSDYYRDMSWGLHSLTWEVLDSIVLPGVAQANATLGPAKNRALDHIRNNLGLKKKIDFTGVVLLHSPAGAGQMRWGDGFGHVNGDFVWSKLPARFGVIRHEIGHNFGHPHHLANSYEWRVKRGQPDQFDGFNMMSGGNKYKISDFAPAAKWHYNWIPDEAIVLLQPEGSSQACPTCRSSVSRLVLTSFDDPTDPPSSTRLKAVHIPVMGDDEEKPSVYSYWLSYRGHGNDGLAAGGLSIHTSHFQLRGMFAATYNSLNFDANGDTKTTEDSFVKPGTCYVVSPPALFMDQSPAAAEEVQPVVCVDELNKGKSITISVSFLDPTSPPVNTVALGSERSLDCTASGETHELTLNLADGVPHMLHFQGTGLGGKISLSSCVESGSPNGIQVYFYDSFPYAFVAFGSPPTYGSYRSLLFNDGCPTFNGAEYLSEYGETFVLLISDGDADLAISTSCDVSSCHANQYFDGGACVNCPAGSISPAESTKASDCVPCEDGLSVFHPKIPVCDQSYQSFPEALTYPSLVPTGAPVSVPTAHPVTLYPTWAPSSSPTATSATTSLSPKIQPSNPITFTSTRVRTPVGPRRGSLVLMLIHAPTNTAITEIHDGDVIRTSTIGVSVEFNIEAVSLDGSVHSVTFVESGHTELSAPFSYCGDIEGNFRICSDLVESSSLKRVSVMPYPGIAQTGSSFPLHSISFRIIN